MKLARIMLFAVIALLALPLAAQTASNMQILAQKVKADKKLVVAANMQLTEEEAKGFRPVYDADQKDLAALNKRLFGVIKNYADAYNQGAVADETAKKLMNSYLAVERHRLHLARPTPRGVKHAQDFDVDIPHAIGNDVGQAADNEFACPKHAPGPPQRDVTG